MEARFCHAFSCGIFVRVCARHTLMMFRSVLVLMDSKVEQDQP